VSHRALLYGLVVECDAPLPGLPVASAEVASQVRVHFGSRPPAATLSTDQGSTEIYRSETDGRAAPVLIADRPGDGRVTRLRYDEGIRFHVDAGGTEVWCDWDPPLTEADAVSFLLGPVLGLVLRRRGVLAVHASAVVAHGAAWAFVGPGGAGKSTLAVAVARAGYALLSEDVLALTPVNEGWLAWPAYDHVRLWADSPALPDGSVKDLPPLSPTWEKRALALDRAGIRQATTAVPLAGWFLLDERMKPGDAPRVAPLAGAAALRALVENAYVNYLMEPAELAAELVALGRAAGEWRALRLGVGDGEAGLAATQAMIVDVIGRTSGAT
jgi:hypothetical protein